MNNSTNKYPLVEELIKFHLSDDLQSGYLAYLNDCHDYYLNNPTILKETKKQLLSSSSNSEYDWKLVAKQNNFFQYHVLKTKEEILLDLKVLCWDVFFPEETLTIEEKINLNNHISKVLTEKNKDNDMKLEFNEIFLYFQQNNIFDIIVNQYALITIFFTPNFLVDSGQIIWGFYPGKESSWRMYSSLGNYPLELFHEIGTNQWFISHASH